MIRSVSAVRLDDPELSLQILTDAAPALKARIPKYRTALPTRSVARARTGASEAVVPLGVDGAKDGDRGRQRVATQRPSPSSPQRPVLGCQAAQQHVDGLPGVATGARRVLRRGDVLGGRHDAGEQHAGERFQGGSLDLPL